MSQLSRANINSFADCQARNTARDELESIFETQNRSNATFTGNLVKVGDTVRFFDHIGFTTGKVITVDSKFSVTVEDNDGWRHVVTMYEFTGLGSEMNYLDRYMKEHEIGFISKSHGAHKTHVNYPGMTSLYNPGIPFYSRANLSKVRMPGSEPIVAMPKKRTFMRPGFKGDFNRSYVS